MSGERVEAELVALTINNLDEVLAIEEDVYTHPWSRGNFVDSFEQGYPALGFRTSEGHLIGYFFVMPVLDELHLLTIAVLKSMQRRGYGLRLLQALKELAQARDFLSVMLEVRVTNLGAIALYQSFGFCEIGRRRAYYPADDGKREDAIVMRLQLREDEHE